MKKMKLDYPKTSADAIRAVCYLRAWSQGRLAAEMGLANGTYLSHIIKGREPGTAEFTARVLAHMPEGLKP